MQEMTHRHTRELDVFYNEHAWLADNAWKYGFILRYPEDKTENTKTDYEPWHYRYVGAESAAKIYVRGLCLDEYIGMMN